MSEASFAYCSTSADRLESEKQLRPPHEYDEPVYIACDERLEAGALLAPLMLVAREKAVMSPSGASGAASLGVVAILLGVLLTAWQANEGLKLAIVGEPPYTVAMMPEPDCEEDELAEEGLTLMSCYQLAYAVHDISISSPEWFNSFHMIVSATGAILALLSVVVGIALVDSRRWAAMAAVCVFGALAILDIVSFTGVVNTGPMIREMYLWSILLWFFIHLAMALGAIVRHQDEQVAPECSDG